MIDEKELEKLSHLCRIALTAEEKHALLHHLKSLVSYFDAINKVPTEGVTLCHGTHSAPLREDVVGETIARDDFLANSPAHVGGMVKVPPVIAF